MSADLFRVLRHRANGIRAPYLDDERSRSILISVSELVEALRSEQPPRLLDVRWKLDRPDGRSDYETSHIPGAVYVDLDSELAEKGAATEGRHPLPSLDHFQRAARSWGLSEGEPVVVYDDLGNMSAARAWWLLKYAGVDDVRLLDGGLNAWIDAAGPIERGPVSTEPGDVRLSFGHMPVMTVDEVRDVPRNGVLLDARAAERYLGQTEPIDPRAGHIPGARNTPTAGNLTEDWRFKDPETLRTRFRDVGVEEGMLVATYCGSGVTAAHNIVALNLAGFEAALYPGSWSQWANLPEREVETEPA